MFEAFKKFAVFSGRARRKEFWLFYLLYAIVIALASVLDATVLEGATIASSVCSLALMVPFLSVSWRRLHDTDRSGRNLLWCLTIIGIIPVIIWQCKDGTPGENRFGANPKEN
ncbi:MAG: DUF805 domain-containing protein [Chitinispirillales bacterium]|nr:DUF805 domain-containing protein [Chitinispirillales bacterium]